MTGQQTVPADPARVGGNLGTPPDPGRPVVAVLAVTQTVGYGALYYAYAVLLAPMTTALHTSTTVVAGALTASVLASAAAAVPVGRWLDRRGARGLMAGGSIAASLLLAAASQVRSVAALYLVWTGIGLASAAVLYEAAFAVIVRSRPRQRARALLTVTVVAGFASSVFLPLTGHLVDRYGWRTAVLVLAALHAAVTVPGHLALGRVSPPVRPDSRPEALVRNEIVALAVRDPGYWALAVAFLASGAAVATVGVHLVAYLHELGHSTTFAATTAGLLGILSVTGRLATTATSRRRSPATVTAIVFALQAAAVAALPLVGHSQAGAVGCVLGFGLGFGVATIARPAILASRYDTSGYATVAGILAVPLTIAKALAPLGAAALRTATGGYTTVALAVAVLCAVAATGLLSVRVIDRHPPSTSPPR